MGTLGLAGVLAVVPPLTAQAPGVPANQDAARLRQLEALREAGALTPDEEEELIHLLAKVRGSFLFDPAELATYYGDDDQARLAMLNPRRWLSNFDLEKTLDHVEYRDYTTPRRRGGIGGAHNAVEWGKHHADYVETSREPHPHVHGVEVVDTKFMLSTPRESQRAACWLKRSIKRFTTQKFGRVHV